MLGNGGSLEPYNQTNRKNAYMHKEELYFMIPMAILAMIAAYYSPRAQYFIKLGKKWDAEWEAEMAGYNLLPSFVIISTQHRLKRHVYMNGSPLKAWNIPVLAQVANGYVS